MAVSKLVKKEDVENLMQFYIRCSNKKTKQNKLSHLSNCAKEALRHGTITQTSSEELEHAREPDQHARELENCITANELETCMWAHRVTSKSNSNVRPSTKTMFGGSQQLTDVSK